jgi:glycosyltransferase involved in cell wall biosynthesis
MLVRRKQGGDETVDKYQPPHRFWERVRRRWRREKIEGAFQSYRSTRPEGLEPFSDDRTQHGARILQQCPPADVLNLHWIANFVDVGCLFENTRTPVVWTLHDMNAFTGGCHYNVDCTRYYRSCGRCPQLGSTEEDDLSRSIWRRKNAAYEESIRNRRLQIVTPSNWLAQEADQSALLSEAEIQVIPYGLDHTTFYPRDTQGLRTALEIPTDHRVVLFVAQSSENRRKGFDLLVDALEMLSTEAVTLVSIGGESPNLETTCEHRHFGTLDSDVLLSVFYSFADLFVIPSRQDNLPNTVLEAMASGTPVIGFKTGGIPDMVRPDETGWLAEVGNVRALRDQIEHALRDKEKRERLGRNCREIVEEEYTLERQATQYQRLYEDLLHRQERSNGR